MSNISLVVIREQSMRSGVSYSLGAGMLDPGERGGVEGVGGG